MATEVVTTKSDIYDETEIQMHRVMYNWKIKNFDRLCTPESKEFEPIPSNRFFAGKEIGRDSEWEILISTDAGYLQLWLYMLKLLATNLRKKEVVVHLTVMILKADGTVMLRRRCDKNQIFTPGDNGWGMGFLIQIETLWDERQSYLADNTLRLCIQIDILGDLVTRHEKPRFGGGNMKVTQMDNDSLGKEEDPSISLLKKDLAKLYKSAKGADFFIECEGKKIPVHKSILTVRSNVFEAMLNHDTIENRSKVVKISDLTESAVSGMLDYIYTGNIKDDSDMDYLVNLVEAGDKYGLIDLKNQCFRRLCDKVSDDDIGKLAILAYMHDAELAVLKWIRQFCQGNWNTLIKLPSFKECLIASPRAFFEDIKGVSDNSSEDETK